MHMHRWPADQFLWAIVLLTKKEKSRSWCNSKFRSTIFAALNWKSINHSSQLHSCYTTILLSSWPENGHVPYSFCVTWFVATYLCVWFNLIIIIILFTCFFFISFRNSENLKVFSNKWILKIWFYPNHHISANIQLQCPQCCTVLK